MCLEGNLKQYKTISVAFWDWRQSKKKIAQKTDDKHRTLTIICVFGVAEATISWYIEQHSTGGRQLFEARGKKCVQLAEGGFVQQVLVWIVTFCYSTAILKLQTTEGWITAH